MSSSSLARRGARELPLGRVALPGSAPPYFALPFGRGGCGVRWCVCLRAGEFPGMVSV